MAFLSFIGRVLFVSVFLISAYQEFRDFDLDGGPAARALRPKFNVFSKHVTSLTGFKLPPIEMKHFIAASVSLKAVGSVLFAYGSSLGALLLLLHQALATPILFDFYNYDADRKEFAQLFVKFTQNLALFGALLFFIGMNNSIPRRQVRKRVPKPKTN
ncbi:hypothetical protein vseg_001147 [Gypsophila vaccaria]